MDSDSYEEKHKQKKAKVMVSVQDLEIIGPNN